MFSGLERERSAVRRQQSVAWAWIKARGVLENRPEPVSSEAAHQPIADERLPWRRRRNRLA